MDFSSGISTTQINDLKEAQQQRQAISMFKNHRKQWLLIKPYQQPESYTENSVLEFNLKGQGVDYINLNGSVLVITITLTNTGTNKPKYAYPTFGSCGLFKRFQFRSGVYDFEDINHWGRFMWHSIMGGAKDGFSNLPSVIGEGIPDDFKILTDGSEYKLQIPFSTCLDNAGYFPVYNLAEELRLRFTLDSGTNAFSVNAGDIDNKYFFKIVDAGLMVDGLVATSGGLLTQKEFKFKSFTTLGFANSVTGPNEVRLDKYSYDVRKTSLKKFLGGYAVAIKSPKNSPAVYRSFSYGEKIKKYSFSMGGVYYPFLSGVSTPFFAWIQYEKYFHRQDVSLIPEHWMVSYSKFKAGDPDKHPEYGYMAGNFDRLDQMSSIISGIDTERYPIQVEVERLAITAVPLLFYAWFSYDIIISVVGGEIKIED